MKNIEIKLEAQNEIGVWVKSHHRWGSNALKKTIRREANKHFTHEQRQYRLIKGSKKYAVTWNFDSCDIELVELADY